MKDSPLPVMNVTKEKYDRGRRERIATAAMQVLIPKEYHMAGTFEECMNSLADKAVLVADILTRKLDNRSES